MTGSFIMKTSVHCCLKSLCAFKINFSKRCKNGSPFQTEVLENLTAKGKKIGHLVWYFSKKEHFREDLLNKISEFHRGCKFCDQLFAQLGIKT
jgi:hypothetical protein